MSKQKELKKNNSIKSLPKNFDINDAWLGIAVDEYKIFNPMAHIPIQYADKPYMYFLYLMQRPEYFYFVCKYVLNINILPIQSLILKEMWSHKFPMLIASRGFGKMEPSNQPIRTKNGWTEMKDLKVGDKVYGRDGKLATIINKTELQENLNMCRITLRDGRKIEVCEDHHWKVWDKNKNRDKKNAWSVLTTKDMIDSFKIDRIGTKSNGTEYRYALPINLPLIEEEAKELLIHPYIVGVLLGDGSITTNSTSITSADEDVINRVRQFLPNGYQIKQSKQNKLCYSISRIDKTLPPFYKLLETIGIQGLNSSNKFIPLCYQFGSYEQKLELIKGLMDTDGYANKSVIEYYTISNKLSSDFLNVARSLGLHCKHSVKETYLNDIRHADCNRISIYTNKPIFSLKRKLDKYVNHNTSKQGQSKYEKVFITNIEKIGKDSGYCIQVDNEDSTYITKDYIVTHNSFILAVYILLRMLLMPGRKIVICGAGFRQSKIVFQYMETIWRNAPVLRSMFHGGVFAGPKHEPDMWRFHLGDSIALAIPIGDGGTIRGLRANDIIADEFASITREVFEVVIKGFAAVRSNPIEGVQLEAINKLRKRLRMPDYEEELGKDDTLESKENQMIISGTAYYDFNHFAEYWKKYKKYIELGSTPEKLFDTISKDDVPDAFDHTQYCIIRIPYHIIPKGFMDDSIVLSSKMTSHTGLFQMEYGAVFSKDSYGFFKRSLIESCTVSPQNEIELPSGKIMFNPVLKGNPLLKYVYAIDPASEVDKFAITVLEMREDHRRIVYVWSTNRKEFKEKVKLGIIKETDYYGYCARKVRELMKVFPCERIAMDSQGGGVAVNEALHDKEKLQPGELPIWPIMVPGEPKDTDGESGLHILELVNFSDSKWVTEANHGLKKDMEDKILIFPFFDTASLGLAEILDNEGNTLYDTLEDCYNEIEELKNELSTIVHTQSNMGRDRWDTPEIKLPGNKKGRLRKDRYSSLVMANMSARQIVRKPVKLLESESGGFANNVKSAGGAKFIGPAWMTEAMEEFYAET